MTQINLNPKAESKPFEAKHWESSGKDQMLAWRHTRRDNKTLGHMVSYQDSGETMRKGKTYAKGESFTGRETGNKNQLKPRTENETE